MYYNKLYCHSTDTYFKGEAEFNVAEIIRGGESIIWFCIMMVRE